MKTVLVTGATGLIGANICEQLNKKGDRVRTIARKPAAPDGLALRELGVEVVPGDITDLACVQKATEDVDGVIHCAALRGLPGATVELSFGPNVVGTINTLTAAYSAGGIPVVQVLTSTYFDMWDKSLTESSPVDMMFRNTDPYSLTKRLAFLEGMQRVAQGQDIRFMLPGGGYGPSPCLENGMFHPSFNSRIAGAIRGGMDPQIPLPVPFVLADDCAWVCIAALEKGAKGERYMAMGRQQDIDTIANSCSRACELAGVAHRVEEVPKARLDDPAILAKYGPTMTSLGKRNYPKPFFDSSFTEKRLGYVPTPLDQGLAVTIDWMRRNKVI
jgi:dihydroflavonol-4-reductase